MVRAFVFVDCAAGTDRPVVSTVREAEGVEDAHVVAGDFDVVAEVTAPEVHDVLSLVTGEIRPLEGVGTTRTYVVLE